MTEERDDYMRRQEADHDLLRMRDPSKAVIERMSGGNYVVHGLPLTERMKRFGITGLTQQRRGGGWVAETENGSDVMPHDVALWFMERTA